MEEKIIVRAARNSDREEVFRFCQKTWSWGDYIPRFWDRWMKQKNGKIFVATINNIPIGMAHVRVDKQKKEAWLSAARTAPEHRRKGVATLIAKKCLEYAKQNGAVKARLVTSSDNKAAQIVLQKLGFKPIAQFVKMTTEKISPSESRNSKLASAEELEALWKFLRESKIFRKSTGLYTVLFRWYSLTLKDLERFIHENKALIYGKDKRVEGLILIDDSTSEVWQENTIQTCYVDGDEKAVADMLGFLLTLCYKKGIKKIYGFAYNDPSLTSAMKKAGFQASETIEIVYEKKL